MVPSTGLCTLVPSSTSLPKATPNEHMLEFKWYNAASTKATWSFHDYHVGFTLLPVYRSVTSLLRAPNDNSPQICTGRDGQTVDLQSLPQGQFSHSIKILNMHTLWPNDSTSRKIACGITHVDTQRYGLYKDVHCIIVLKSGRLEMFQLSTIKGSDK